MFIYIDILKKKKERTLKTEYVHRIFVRKLSRAIDKSFRPCIPDAIGIFRDYLFKIIASVLSYINSTF